MLRTLGALVVALPLATPALHAPAAVAATPAAAPPVHTVTVGGTGTGMYPAFDPDVERYAVTTGPDSGGTLTVTATTSDPAGRILIDGRRDADGTATLSGLEGGDEVSVVIEDAGGRAVHSLVYLPAYFPRLETVVDEPGTTAGDVLLTLFNVRQGTGPRPSFETAVDRNGVPRWVEATPAGKVSMDLKPAGFGGHWTVSRPTATSAGRTGAAVVELDEQFRPVRSFETVGLADTDNHDSIVRADGSRILVGYEPNAATGRVDSTIQEVDADGDVVYTWNSGDHLDPALETTSAASAKDYAHINSIQVMPDGDILASFRNLSAVLKIAWSAHDGYQRGDVVWRLGGRHSDFTFVDDPYPSGPCAQHTANLLPNGHVLIYDNGSVLLGADQSNCVNPADPSGPTINRPQTRITEYALDEGAGTATLVWDYVETGRFAYFAGSARRLPNDHTLIGWAAAQQAVATEVDADEIKLWEIRTADGYITYRAVKAVVPDAIPPTARVLAPTEGASYVAGARVPVDVTCRDRGGSSLHGCTAPQTLDTASPGEHTVAVTAVDGAGNTTTVTRTYTVVPATRVPDAAVKRTEGGAWVGNDVLGGYGSQTVQQALARTGAVRSAVVRVRNDGNTAARFAVLGTAGGVRFRVQYLVAGTDRTPAVVAGRYRTQLLAPGTYVDLRVRVTRLRSAVPGNARTFRVRASSLGTPERRDAVATRVRAVRR